MRERKEEARKQGKRGTTFITWADLVEILQGEYMKAVGLDQVHSYGEEEASEVRRGDGS